MAACLSSPGTHAFSEAMMGRWPGQEPGPGCMVPRLLLAPKAPHTPVLAEYPMYPPFSLRILILCWISSSELAVIKIIPGSCF